MFQQKVFNPIPIAKCVLTSIRSIFYGKCVLSINAIKYCLISLSYIVLGSVKETIIFDFKFS